MARDRGLELIGFEELQDILDPAKFTTRITRHVKRATSKNALVGVGMIKRAIDSGKFASNKPMTSAIKGSSRPLVDSGQLKLAITKQVKTWYLANIGVIRSKTVTDAQGRSEDVLSIAKVLHEGATIAVTPKMRRYFALMSRKFPDQWFPLKADTTSITIPPRPFLLAAISDKAVLIYQTNWAAAVQKALNGDDK